MQHLSNPTDTLREDGAKDRSNMRANYIARESATWQANWLKGEGHCCPKKNQGSVGGQHPKIRQKRKVYSDGWAKIICSFGNEWV